MLTPWPTYEDVARRVLLDMKEALGISRVECKQTVGGASTSWELDAKALTVDGKSFLVVEARRHTASGLKQEDMAAIAFRIDDLGAKGGIVVSPLPLQRGAKAIAAAKNIAHVKLAADSTLETYFAEFLGRAFIGASIVEFANLTDICDAQVGRGNTADA
jgi:hypothetical protein